MVAWVAWKALEPCRWTFTGDRVPGGGPVHVPGRVPGHVRYSP
ncbi:hypothetical protein FHS43_001870 [Streptosporangium becharense]|nr:hypothetical protein [Streptosporangium becharense]